MLLFIRFSIRYIVYRKNSKMENHSHPSRMKSRKIWALRCILARFRDFACVYVSVCVCVYERERMCVREVRTTQLKYDCSTCLSEYVCCQVRE